MLCPAVCRVKTLSPEGNSRGRPYPDKLVAARTTLGSQDCRHGTFKFYDNPVVSTSIIRASEVVLGHYFLPLFSLLMRFLKRQSWNFVLLVKAATAKTTAQKVITMTESATWSEKLMFILSSFLYCALALGLEPRTSELTAPHSAIELHKIVQERNRDDHCPFRDSLCPHSLPDKKEYTTPTGACQVL